MKKRFEVAAVAVLLFVSNTLFAANDSKRDGEWWIKSYGQITADKDNQVARAEMVFQTLWTAMRPTSLKQPVLIVVPRSSEKWLESWAITLSDGSVILVRSLLDLVLKNSEDQKQISESRLAFILAHELAHLIHHDHQKLGPTMLFSSGENESVAKETREAEFRADRTGLFLMTTAGYNPGEILVREDDSFFSDYESRVRDRICAIGKRNQSLRYSESGQRAEQLRKRLLGFVKELKIFHRAVKAYQDKEYQAAAENFAAFSKIFPSREVLNNLGLCYYQQARLRLAGCQEPTYDFALATYLETETRAEKLISGQITTRIEDRTDLNCKKDDITRELLNKARHQFELAEEKDAGYLPARLNKSALLITSSEYKKAAEECDAVLLMDEKYAGAVNNKAVALYLQQPDSPKETTIALWKKVPASNMYYQAALRNIDTAQSSDLDPGGIKAPPRLKHLRDIISNAPQEKNTGK